MICKKRLAKSQLARHVLVPGAEGGGLEADAARTKPGRGWYLCDEPECRRKFSGRVRPKRKEVGVWKQK